uniref:Phosphomannomutase n=1 Tax=Metchnikovella dogieli TaxID=2804710 RepID=A0A896WBG5_9MICR|nr:phosphomannomutase [Metchnikovella dogieli]
MAIPDRNKKIVLFDVDGTLTPSRLLIKQEMVDLLTRLKEKVMIGFVGGSNIEKQKEQVGDMTCGFFDFSFPENGLTAYKGTSLISETSFLQNIGEEKYKHLVNFTLRYIADLDIPIKRGTFVELRKGMINVSPIGRNCTYEERLEFSRLDDEMGIRNRMVEEYKKVFEGYGLSFSIGGQISIDIFPIGWDKTFCLRHLHQYNFEEIHFFGDKTNEGGNDFEIFNHKEVIGHRVTSPEDTMRQVSELFGV